jgi:hypothetical protein
MYYFRIWLEWLRKTTINLSQGNWQPGQKSQQFWLHRPDVHSFRSVIRFLLAYFSCFEKVKVGLWNHLAICMFVYSLPATLARQRLGKHVGTNTYGGRRIVRRIVFYEVHVVSEESRRLVLPRTACILFWCICNVSIWKLCLPSNDRIMSE